MNEYRIDVVDAGAPEATPLHREYFEARTDDAAAKKALRILKAHATGPQEQYGDLWMRDADGGASADYVTTIEVTP